jgi:ring-1,2-phenylacetyl-CoA epoxidase subunit PaaC
MAQPRAATPSLAPEVATRLADHLLAAADDELVLGHRHAEWTGFGPDIESDIALSSVAQEEIGHARLLYQMVLGLQGRSEEEVDRLAFGRPPQALRNAVLLERPNDGGLEPPPEGEPAWRGEWGFTVVRMVLYDHADAIRLETWASGGHEPLAALARTLAREERYHRLFAETWLERLAGGGPAAAARLQRVLDAVWGEALGLFETTDGEAVLVAHGLLPRSSAEQAERWRDEVAALLEGMGLRPGRGPAATGGRAGRHTPDLAALLEEMTLVWRLDPEARW